MKVGTRHLFSVIWVGYKSSTCKGVFEQLTQYIAAGFNPDSEPAKTALSKSFAQGGVFEFDEDELKLVASFAKSKKKKKTAREIMIELTAYQFELVYDLSISDLTNISGSAGFEAFVGMSTA